MFQLVPNVLALDMLQVVLVTGRSVVLISNLVVGRDHLLAVGCEEVTLPFGMIVAGLTEKQTRELANISHSTPFYTYPVRTKEAMN